MKSTWELPALIITEQPPKTIKRRYAKYNGIYPNLGRKTIALKGSMQRAIPMESIPSRDNINTVNIKPSDKTAMIKRGGL